MTDMIRAEGLVKRYRDVVALDGLDLTVGEGRVLGLLGPNGAGKTTAVRIITTLLSPDAGAVRVAGIDAATDPDGVRARIGLSGQYAAIDEHLTGFENLRMVGRLYGMTGRAAAERADELLARFDLLDARNRPSKTYSGGMRRRLDLAAAVVAAPPVIVLDEPTTGLDVRSRQQMWGVIKELVAGGSTMLLTTQYLEEADLLADDILVIDHGRAIAQGSPDELKRQIGGERIEMVLAEPAQSSDAARILDAVALDEVQASDKGRHLAAGVSGGAGDLASVLTALRSAAIDVLDIGLRRPTMDDVFLSLTGHAAEAEDELSVESDEAMV
ncbi:MAG TPA: ATP-binding cassette domain-containing protein [Aeromicrobium sp.]|nr:ATP-binding cassette domain-containing protein [Aeromicrobium sp.]